MDSREWQEGAVKRLARIYEGKSEATAHHDNPSAHIPKVIESPNRTRQESRPRWSRTSSLDSSSTLMSSASARPFTSPTTSVANIKLRRVKNSPSDFLKKCRDSSSCAPSKGEYASELPSRIAISPLNALSTPSLPTPPESPATVITHRMSLPTPLTISPRDAPLKPRAAKLDVFSSSYPEISQSFTQHIPKIRLRDFDDEGTRSREVSLSELIADDHGCEDKSSASSKPFNQSCRSTKSEALRSLEDNIETSQADVDVDGSGYNDTKLEAYLTPLHRDALKALEDDTSTLVDALRTLINSLHLLAADIDVMKRPQHPSTISKIKDEGTINTKRAYFATVEDGDEDGVKDTKATTSIGSRGRRDSANPYNSPAAATARSDLSRMKNLLDILKAPRQEMLELAKTGPSPSLLSLPSASSQSPSSSVLLGWGELYKREKLRLLYQSLQLLLRKMTLFNERKKNIVEYDIPHYTNGRGKTNGDDDDDYEGKISRIKKYIVAVVSEDANQEFLAKTMGWEEGVTQLEKDGGIREVLMGSGSAL